MIDDGYYDMNKIMRALVDVKFEGIVIPDHVPGLGANPNAEPGRGRGGGGGRGQGEFRPNPALAYLLGCMNSMLLAAQGKQG
jgi:D-mannonate dehydratase